jgi:hypothetical protein
MWVGVGTEPGMVAAFQGTWSVFEHRFSWSHVTLLADLFNATISYEKTSPVPYPFYIKDYEHYAHADILPWGSRLYDVSLLQVSYSYFVVLFL